MLNLKHFEIFLTVADCESFTKSANKLNVTKAAISQNIRLLEEEMKVPLFIRSTRSIKLSEEGEQLYHQCRRLKKELDFTRDMVQGFSNQPKGTLTISANPTYMQHRLFKLIQMYHQRFPDVDIHVNVEERMPDMNNEDVDLVFGINWPPPLDIIRREIDTTRYILCASPEYLKQHGTPKIIKDIEKHTYIPHTSRDKNTPIVNLKKPQTLNLQKHLSTNSQALMRDWAIAGFGITQLHDYVVEDAIESGKLVEILQHELEPSIPLYIYYQKHRFVQPKIRQFVNLILQESSTL